MINFDKKRTRIHDSKLLSNWFDFYEIKIKEYNIQLENIWNMNEKNFARDFQNKQL